MDGNNTRVAVITFSTSASVDINDLEPRSQTDVVTTKCSLYTRLDNLVAKHAPYGYTATHDALQLATAVSARCVALMLGLSAAIGIRITGIHLTHLTLAASIS